MRRGGKQKGRRMEGKRGERENEGDVKSLCDVFGFCDPHARRVSFTGAGVGGWGGGRGASTAVSWRGLSGSHFLAGGRKIDRKRERMKEGRGKEKERKKGGKR